MLADGFRQSICYGVEITEYSVVVSGQSAGSGEGIGLEGQTVAEVAAFRLWGNWGRGGLVRLARGGGGREGSSAPGGRPGAFFDLDPLEIPERSLGSGHVEIVGFLNELG